MHNLPPYQRYSRSPLRWRWRLAAGCFRAELRASATTCLSWSAPCRSAGRRCMAPRAPSTTQRTLRSPLARRRDPARAACSHPRLAEATRVRRRSHPQTEQRPPRESAARPSGSPQDSCGRAAGHVPVPVAELVDDSPGVVAFAQLLTMLGSDNRRQRRRVFQRYDRQGAAGPHAVQQIPRATACRRLYVVVVKHEIIWLPQPTAGLGDAVLLIAPHLVEPFHDPSNAVGRVDVGERGRPPAGVRDGVSRVGHLRHRFGRRRHVRRRKWREPNEIIYLARNPRH